MSASAVSPVHGVKRIVTRLAVIAFGLLAILAGISATAAAHASASTPRDNWIMTGWNIHLASQADPSTTGHFFNTPGSYGTGPDSNTNPISDGPARSVNADGFYISATTPTLGQAGQFLDNMQAAGY
jgi:hypothetical protein